MIYLILFILIFLFIIIYCANQNKLFYDINDVYPELQKISRYRTKIMEEVNQILNDPKCWEQWPEKHLYANNGKWNIFPLFAFDIWVNENCNKLPTLTKFIKSIPGIKLATLSKLSAGMKLTPHRGWGNHSNYVLRTHYGLIVPENKCYVRVNNEKQFHKNDEWIVFDDSEEHMAENTSNTDRVVLIIDIARPANVQNGTSDIGDSKELLDIINYFKQKNIN